MVTNPQVHLSELSENILVASQETTLRALALPAEFDKSKRKVVGACHGPKVRVKSVDVVAGRCRGS